MVGCCSAGVDCIKYYFFYGLNVTTLLLWRKLQSINFQECHFCILSWWRTLWIQPIKVRLLYCIINMCCSCISYFVYLSNGSNAEDPTCGIQKWISRKEVAIYNPVSPHIVLMRTNVIHLLNRVSEHDFLTFFVQHRTKCKPMHFEQG